jgi:N6-adenosine-specific RNA methylase IME4
MMKVDLPDKKYAVIYADPPWTYRQHGTSPKSRGNAAQHYKTMTTDEICRLPVQNIAKREAALFLWATFPQTKTQFR